MIKKRENLFTFVLIHINMYFYVIRNDRIK
uniref:Uncharacterized protein n=1 Tax=Lepeophtheirus salmonis TaxID=72036 RepID=A0A0K2UJG6_LEPSM